MKQLIYELKTFGFRVALNNFLLIHVMRFIGAKSYHLTYFKKR